MINEVRPTALIADDEPLLVQALEKALASVWPELLVTSKVGNGESAISQLLSGSYDIAFLDIQMPGHSGIEVVQAVIEEWPETEDAKPTPLFVFVTAHDEFAIDAFELAAIDYVVKPVSDNRLKKTVERLSQSWQVRQVEPALNTLVNQVNEFVLESRKEEQKQEKKSTPNADWLEAVRAGIGDTVHMIPVKEVIMFEASDKYVVVHTAQHEALIRESLRNLLPRLNPAQFRQIHRSTIVNLDYVLAALKAGGSKMTLKLRDTDHTPVVSRLYRHLFKAM